MSILFDRLDVPGCEAEGSDERWVGSRGAGFHRGAAEPRNGGGGGGVEQARQGPQDLRDEPRVSPGDLGTSCRYYLGGGWVSRPAYNGAGLRFQAATGYQASWLQGRSYWSLVHPADVQRLRGAVTRRKRKFILKLCS